MASIVVSEEKFGTFKCRNCRNMKINTPPLPVSNDQFLSSKNTVRTGCTLDTPFGARNNIAKRR